MRPLCRFHIRYQGGGRGVDEAFIQTTSKKVQDGIFPDMTFYVKTPHADNASVPLLPRLADDETFESASGDFIGEWRVLMKKLPSGKNRE